MKKIVLLLCSVFVLLSCAKKENLEPFEPESPRPEVPEVNHSVLRQNIVSTSFNINESIVFNITDEAVITGIDYGVKFHTKMDSIQWSIKGVDKHLNLISKNNFIIVWSQVFYLPGKYESYLVGYKDNKVVLSDTVTFFINDARDFLGYNWNELKKEEGFQGLDMNEFYNVSFNTAVEIQNNVATVELVARPVKRDACKVGCSLEKESLFDYMNELYGSPKEGFNDVLKNKDYYTANFHKKLSQEDVLAIWETPKTVIALLKTNDSTGFDYKVRAEARK